jgi:hypothetical protein
VEFGIVLKSTFAANGHYARVLNLKTKDVEERKMGAGHVLIEAWSEALNKWILFDPQFNVMPMLGELPLNAVEFQKALQQGEYVRLVDLHGDVSKKRHKQYMQFIGDYLFFFDTRFDQRELNARELLANDGNFSMMLVPEGEKEPVTFQRIHALNKVAYTHSLNDFYRRPE